jgi:hypothetical protein
LFLAKKEFLTIDPLTAHLTEPDRKTKKKNERKQQAENICRSRTIYRSIRQAAALLY